MNSTQISFTTQDIALKKRVMEKLKRRGLTMKALFLSAMESFDKGEVTISLTSNQDAGCDDIMTKENEENYTQAKKDLENGVNIVSWEEMKTKHLA